jgi:pimeloyl-ACP methyl ester carboxylesterase
MSELFAASAQKIQRPRIVAVAPTLHRRIPAGASSSAQSKTQRSRAWAWLIAFALVAAAAASASYLRCDLQSYSLLVHFADPQASGPLLRWETKAISTQNVTIPTASGTISARLYLPMGAAHAPGMVVAHGIHHLGMDEPRLVSFARAVAGEGYAVLTPQITSLADYRVDPTSIATIGESAVWLEQRESAGPVTVAGVSFAGGLSLLAASDPTYAPHIRALILMGAYDDLARVSRFLVTSQAELPDGRFIPYAAHDYGAAVFVYAHLSQFFPESDLPAAREALRDWLWEQPQNAQPLIVKMSPPSREVMNALLARQIDRLQPQLLHAIDEDQSELAAISPQGHIASLRVPVYILHGSSDNIIPSTESLWLQREVPARYLREVLITPAFSHVDPAKKMAWKDKLRIVQFIAGVLRATQ